MYKPVHHHPYSAMPTLQTVCDGCRSNLLDAPKQPVHSCYASPVHQPEADDMTVHYPALANRQQPAQLPTL